MLWWGYEFGLCYDFGGCFYMLVRLFASLTHSLTKLHYSKNMYKFQIKFILFQQNKKFNERYSSLL